MSKNGVLQLKWVIVHIDCNVIHNWALLSFTASACINNVYGARGGPFTGAHKAPPPWIQCHGYFVYGLGLPILLAPDSGKTNLQREVEDVDW